MAYIIKYLVHGLFYFILLSVEKLVMNRKSSDNSKLLSILGRILGNVYTLMVVVLLWVIFRSNSVTDAMQYMVTMFSAGASGAYAVGVIVAVFVIACCMTIDGSYNPFIYFNF